MLIIVTDWFDNFTASQNGRSSGFTANELDQFHLAYQRYLFLLAKFERKMEWIGFAPTPAVDLSKGRCIEMVHVLVHSGGSVAHALAASTPLLV